VQQFTPHHQLLAYMEKGVLLCFVHENDGRISRRQWYTLSELQLKSMRLSFPPDFTVTLYDDFESQIVLWEPFFSRIPRGAPLPYNKILFMCMITLTLLRCRKWQGPCAATIKNAVSSRVAKSAKFAKNSKDLSLAPQPAVGGRLAVP
jgi:hypothetical protein